MVGDSDYYSGYCIRLANGQGWRIVAHEGVQSWVDKLATIMRLRICESNGYPKLIFIKRESAKQIGAKAISHLNQRIKECLPLTGWNSKDLVWIQVWSHGEVPHVICEIGTIQREEGNEQEILGMRGALQPIYQRAQDIGGLPLHAALVEWNKKGVLLAAPANTGKSTCCRRLPASWYPHCDEETLILKDGYEQYLAHPFPTWSDYFMGRFPRTWDIQQHLPLCAIFFLEQAEKDEVLPVGQGETAVLMSQSATQVCYRNWLNLNPREMRILKEKVFENACAIARRVPAYKLRVSLEGYFWEEMEKVLA